MNILSRIVACLIVMMVTVAVQADWVPISMPSSTPVKEGAADFNQTFDIQNRFTYAVDVIWLLPNPPLKIVGNGGDSTDQPAITNLTVTPTLEYGPVGRTDWYSVVNVNADYVLTFKVVPPKDIDPKGETVDSGYTTVQLQMVWRKHLDAGWINEYDTPLYTYTATDVPEPASLVLLGIGAIGLLARRRQAA